MYVHSVCVCVSISLQYVVKKLTAAVVELSVLDIIKNAHTFFFFFYRAQAVSLLGYILMVSVNTA